MTDPTPGMPAALSARLGTSATGWGAIIDGVLNIRTVTDGRNAAALNALYIGGFAVHSACRNPDCDCMVRALEGLMSRAQLVPVTVRVEGLP
jgi:hypothetical protein